jgi:hypothetical protein
MQQEAMAAPKRVTSMDFTPRVPETIEDTGLPASTIEQLLLKALYFRGDTTGRDLASGVGLKFSLIDPLMDHFKRQHLVDVKRSLGMGNVSALYALSDAGRALARECLNTNQYEGPAPVPIAQYNEAVRRQRLQHGWLTKDVLSDAYRHMVVNPHILSQIGPAVNSGKSFLIYGQPGNGKTFLAEALFRLERPPIFVPYAIEYQGQIVKMFDPVYHRRIEEAETVSAISEHRFDARWFRCTRPFIVTGGELALEMLDLSYNATAQIYDAPLQLKANNGIYLIDDFGRQKATPAEVLNRWIIPMESRVDYLNFTNGGKVGVPFETFLVFSTNLKPEQLGDEAFLRRIQYKMFLGNPSEDEFLRIFENCASDHKLEYTREVVVRLLERRYRATGKRLRRCHPRDILAHAVDLIRFERLPMALTDEVLDHAFEGCFTVADFDE